MKSSIAAKSINRKQDIMLEEYMKYLIAFRVILTGKTGVEY